MNIGTTETTLRPRGFLSNTGLTVALIAVVGVALAILFDESIAWMTKKWAAEEYNHAWLIPPIAFYLIWLRARQLDTLSVNGSWAGVGLVVVSLVLLFIGQLSAIFTISQYGLVLVIWGLALACVGTRGVGLLWAPLLYLVFMVPLPNFIETRLTSGLMLLSSQIGVEVIRLSGITVFLEGNVIDLGSYQLQVAEACSGMRYLFPLTSFGFLCAVLFHGRWWQKAILFLSTVPITLLMNSFRIGVIGILVNYFGIEQAEGFLHDFEGWVVFMACVGILFLEVWIFARIEKRRFLEIFGLDVPSFNDLGQLLRRSRATAPVLTSVAVLLVVTLISLTVSRSSPLLPERAPLSSFPLRIGDWSGVEIPLDKVYLDVLQVSDYLLSTYSRRNDGAPVGIWVAYYDAQTQGVAVHSPQACLPGGGWQIDVLSERTIPNIGPAGGGLRINRAEISLGQERQLVYYWFPQRGRNLTSEYLVKWYILQDSLTSNRTDGALVRLTTPVGDVTQLAQADARLEAFVRELDPKLAYYLPGANVVTRAGTPAVISAR